MRAIIFLLLVYFVKFIIKELSKPEVSKVDELINAIPNRVVSVADVATPTPLKSGVGNEGA